MKIQLWMPFFFLAYCKAIAPISAPLISSFDEMESLLHQFGRHRFFSNTLSQMWIHPKKESVLCLLMAWATFAVALLHSRRAQRKVLLWIGQVAVFCVVFPLLISTARLDATYTRRFNVRMFVCVHGVWVSVYTVPHEKKKVIDLTMVYEKKSKKYECNAARYLARDCTIRL